MHNYAVERCGTLSEDQVLNCNVPLRIIMLSEKIDGKHLDAVAEFSSNFHWVPMMQVMINAAGLHFPREDSGQALQTAQKSESSKRRERHPSSHGTVPMSFSD